MFDRIEFIGHVGRDPEMRYTDKGQAVTGFSVAVNRSWKNSAGEKVEETIWYKVATWGKLAEICKQYVTKGMQVFVEGQLVADKETGGPRIFTRGDGSSGASFEVRADTVKFLGGNKPDATPSAEEESIPF